MKNVFTFLLVIFIAIAKAQIPNAGFENWTSGVPDNWFSSSGSAFISPDSNAHSGNLSIRMQTMQSGSSVTTTTLYSRAVPGSTYYPLGTSQNPVAVTFWAITNLQSGDVLTINTSLKSTAGNIVGIINGTCVSTVSPTWQFYSFPIQYSTMAVLDSGATWFTFRNGVCTPNINPLHAGTYVLIDDLSFDGTSGINPPSGNMYFSVFPNPVKDIATLTYETGLASISEISLYDIFGKKVRSFEGPFQTDENHVELNMINIAEGAYFLIVNTSEGRNILKIVVGN